MPEAVLLEPVVLALPEPSPRKVFPIVAVVTRDSNVVLPAELRKAKTELLGVISLTETLSSVPAQVEFGVKVSCPVPAATITMV